MRLKTVTMMSTYKKKCDSSNSQSNSPTTWKSPSQTLAFSSSIQRSHSSNLTLQLYLTFCSKTNNGRINFLS
jgi:hypothetical protein